MKKNLEQTLDQAQEALEFEIHKVLEHFFNVNGNLMVNINVNYSHGDNDKKWEYDGITTELSSNRTNEKPTNNNSF